MRKTVSLLASLAVVGLSATGCANYGTHVQQKMGRGIANTTEIVRGGEFRRTMEQPAIFSGPDTGYSLGFVRGVNRTIGRTFIGVFEVATAPLPPFRPLATDHFA